MKYAVLVSFFGMACGQSNAPVATEAGADGPSCKWTAWDGTHVVCPNHTCCRPGLSGSAWCNAWWCDDATSNAYHQCTSLPCSAQPDAGSD